MAPINSGVSVYHAIQCMYWRTRDGKLLTIEGRRSTAIRESWPELWKMIYNTLPESARLQLPSGKEVCSVQLTVPCLDAKDECRSAGPHTNRIHELQTQKDGLVLGLWICGTRYLYESGDDFYNWAEIFFLLEMRFLPFRALKNGQGVQAACISEQIADIFDAKLRNVSSEDQWFTGGGRSYFINRTFGFVDQGLPIQLCLPAFPCKSPNLRKVGGATPDMAEYIALDALQEFPEAIAAVYEPGAILWIISDGHVFSDCIGVDDSVVSSFHEKLKEVYEKRYGHKQNSNAWIRFMSLNDIFFSNGDTNALFSSKQLSSYGLPHLMTTERTDEAELSRKLLMATCQMDRENFRSLVNEQDPHTLKLYRGLSKFMLDDLAYDGFSALSMSQRKKVASKVATEMITRNQAYSNLVELLFPQHIRLSIHAHPNCGPKFSIRLFPSDRVQAISSLEDRHTPNPIYEFQLPTPWHNSITKIQGDKVAYLCRSDMIRKAIASGKYEGEWVTGLDGGHFSLKLIELSRKVEDVPRYSSVQKKEDVPILIPI